MADTITLPGTGKIVATEEVSSKHYQAMKLALGAVDAVDGDLDAGQQLMANSLPVTMASDQSTIKVDSPVILSAGITHTTITCTNADTDYSASGAIPAGTKRVTVFSNTYMAIVGVETTTATNGGYIDANVTHEIPATPGDTLHGQSPTAGTKIYITYWPS